MKYRLIKEYPGGPELGTEVIYSESHKIYNYNGGNFYSELPKNQVENLPEFWEKVVEKDYEIMSFSHPCGLTTLRNNGYYVYHKSAPFDCPNSRGATLNEILNKEEYYDYKIHSVRRLSDGKIFTIGDVLKRGKITEFKILKGKSNTEHSARIDRLLEKVDDKIGVIIDNHHIPTELLSELNTKPLFTTEDGVELFEGDEFWFLNKTLNFPPEKSKNYLNDSHVLYFSTKEAAEEYILMNKPCLSINDVILNFNSSIDVEKLKELVKLLNQKG